MPIPPREATQLRCDDTGINGTPLTKQSGVESFGFEDDGGPERGACNQRSVSLLRYHVSAGAYTTAVCVTRAHAEVQHYSVTNVVQ